jgi:hypothetical protein
VSLAFLLSTSLQKFANVFRRNHSLTVVALIRAARVSKRFRDTSANFRNGVLRHLQEDCRRYRVEVAH